MKPIHPSWQFYALVLGLFCGLVVSIAFRLPLCGEFYWLFLAIAFFIVTLCFSRRLFLIFAFLSGFILGNFRAFPYLASQNLFSSLSGQTVTLSGTVSDDPDFSAGNYVIHLQNLCLISESAQNCSVGTAYVKLAREADLARSDTVTLRGKLSDGFGTFVTSLFRPEITSITKPNPGHLFAQFKAFFAERVRTYLGSPAADLGLGYLMGEKSGLTEDFSEALRLVGITHVIVASGSHLGILVSVAKRLFGRISKFAGLLSSLLLTAVFVLIVGFTPSMTRAALVTSLSLLAGYVGRQFTPWRLLSLVASLTLFIEPINFLSLGWQLSFASFFGILILAPRLSRFLYGGKTPPWLASMLITSFATGLVCAPILIYNFGSLSLLSLVANLLILPTLPYAMLLVFLTGAASFCPPIARAVAYPTTVLLQLHIFFVNFLSEKTMFVINLPADNPIFFLLYLPILVFVAWPHLRRALPPLTKNKSLWYSNNYES